MEFNQIPQIVQGWKNLMFKNETVENEAINRLTLCNRCPDRSNYPEELTLTSTCKLCGCVLKAKARSPHATCPSKKW